MEEKDQGVMNVVSDVSKVVETVTPVVTKKWTWKKVLLSIVTLYFVIILLKWLLVGIWKLLDLTRRYIHNLTDETKFIEVVFWTIVGVILGVVLHKQIMLCVDWIVRMWNTYILPFFMV